MRLPQRFFKLPVGFDAARLEAEIDELPAEAWAPHPTGEPGNSAVRLVSVDGGENDQMHGVMRTTRHLERLPYVRQVLAGFGVVWGRSRLLRLAPGAKVSMHSDIYHHWFYRTRVHIPITTRPEVRFTCDGETINMAAGECWIFDNWRQHAVDNPTDCHRVHLVADTTGTAAFWELVARGVKAGASVEQRPYDPARSPELLMERSFLRPVMSPEEMELLVMDTRSELIAEADTADHQARLAAYHAMLLGFARDWRQLHLLHGDEAAERKPFVELRERVRERSRALAPGLVMRSNRVSAEKLLEARILRVCVAPTAAP
jgi:quercetin dioxygenase-like cupin family protein